MLNLICYVFRVFVHSRVFHYKYSFVWFPSKYKTFVYHLYNVGPTSKTLARRCYTNVLYIVIHIQYCICPPIHNLHWVRVLNKDDNCCCFVGSLAANTSTSVLMAVDFNDTTQPAQFTIGVDDRKHPVSLTAPVGELVQPYTMTENDFNNLQGKSCIQLCPRTLRRSTGITLRLFVCLSVCLLMRPVYA